LQHESDRTEAFRRRLAALSCRGQAMGAGFHPLASAAAHLGFLALAALATPALHEGPEDARADEPARWVRQALSAVAEPDLDTLLDPGAEPSADGRMRAQTRCGKQYGGASGEVAYEVTRHHHGVAGPADNPDPHIAKRLWYDSSSLWPIAMLLSIYQRADLDAPTVFYGREDSLGRDPRSARATLFGDEIGMALGAPGIGMSTRRICWRCGDDGLGARVPRERTARAGAVDTESTFMASSR
jgi:hypothetical protein